MAGLISVWCVTAQPVYSFHKDADSFLELAFPRKSIQVNVSRAYQERTNRFTPTDLDEVLNKNISWARIIDTNGSYKIPDDTSESCWLSGIARRADPSLIASDLLSPANTLRIAVVCSNLISADNMPFQSVLEKALFQRDVFQFYFIFKNCTNFAISLNESALRRRESTADLLRQLLLKLRLDEGEYANLTNSYRYAMETNPSTSDDVFDPSANYLPLREVVASIGWYEMRFPASENKHFRHFEGRSFIRIFANTPNWSREQFDSYWDDVQRKFGDRVHLNYAVPSLPPKSQTMLLRTFAVLLTDGTIADSGIPEEILIRAFKTSKRQLDLNSTDYLGTYFYVYKMSRRLMLTKPESLGVVRHLDDKPTFYGFHSEVPDLRDAHDHGLVTMRYNCISCHSPALYGSSTVFSLGKHRLKTPGTDQFSGDLLRGVSNRPGRYIFGPLNENLALEN